jgi:hypothetical protein
VWQLTDPIAEIRERLENVGTCDRCYRKPVGLTVVDHPEADCSEHVCSKCLLSELARLEWKNQELREALEPFCTIPDISKGMWTLRWDGEDGSKGVIVITDEVHRARRALGGSNG